MRNQQAPVLFVDDARLLCWWFATVKVLRQAHDAWTNAYSLLPRAKLEPRLPIQRLAMPNFGAAFQEFIPSSQEAAALLTVCGKF
jgi:hypothetical protein